LTGRSGFVVLLNQTALKYESTLAPVAACFRFPYKKQSPVLGAEFDLRDLVRAASISIPELVYIARYAVGTVHAPLGKRLRNDQSLKMPLTRTRLLDCSGCRMFIGALLQEGLANGKQAVVLQ
jgi:hypothetical protein